jgi:hypothetical protein
MIYYMTLFYKDHNIEFYGSNQEYTQARRYSHLVSVLVAIKSICFTI